MDIAADSLTQGDQRTPHVIMPFTLDDDLQPIVAAWASAFADPPNGPRPAGELFRQLYRHMTYPRFVGLVAREPGTGHVLGLAYGYSNEPGQWWRDCVARALGTQAAAMLDDSFCLTELGVIMSARRRGIAEDLVDGLAARQSHPRMVLSTRSDNTGGLRFYYATGWRTMLRAMSFGWNFPPYDILERRVSEH
jgi:ribosomal protein S18 acetylase RimI-like enzyme